MPINMNVKGIVVIALAIGFIPFLLGLAEVIPDYPVMDIEIHVVGVRVDFEFSQQGRNLPVPGKVPIQVWKCVVYLPDGSTVWQVISQHGASRVSRITYGIVPPGYFQVAPDEGPAPTLEPMKEYRVSASGEGHIGVRTFVYKGVQSSILPSP